MPRDALSRPDRPPVEGTASISGVVISADLGRPVRRATVRLANLTPSMPQATTTDDQGRFAFDHVAAGQFTLAVSKPGYLDSIFGQRRTGSGRPGTPLSITDGQKLDRLSVPIARGGVLAGTVTDDGGEPAFGTEVRALKYTWQGGERMLRTAGSDKADDRGNYRIGALPPGDYVVMAVPAGETVILDDINTFPGFAPARADFAAHAGPLMVAPDGSDAMNAAVTTGYTPVFYPQATLSRNATTVALDVGEEHAGLDLQIPLIPMGRVTGTISDADGRPVANTEVRLTNLEETLPGIGSKSASSGPGGRFTFTDVPAGRYRVRAHSGPSQTILVDERGGQPRVMMRFEAGSPAPGPDGLLPGRMNANPPNEPQQWAAADVVVSGRDSQEVALRLQPGVTVSGRVVFDGSDQPPTDLTSLRIVLNTVGGGEGVTSAAAQVGADGRFTVANVIPGTYRALLLAGSGWRLKSFEAAGADALDFLLEVPPDRGIAEAVATLSKRTTTLSGTLTGAAGQPAADCTILVFADDPRYWTAQSRRIQAARPATDGRFAFSNLPAGAYRLIAVDDLDEGQWFDPAVLRQVSGAAVAITLADGERHTQDIRIAR